MDLEKWVRLLQKARGMPGRKKSLNKDKQVRHVIATGESNE